MVSSLVGVVAGGIKDGIVGEIAAGDLRKLFFRQFMPLSVHGFDFLTRKSLRQQYHTTSAFCNKHVTQVALRIRAFHSGTLVDDAIVLKMPLCVG